MRIWARLISSRLSNETWQATFVIPAGFETNSCFNKTYMSALTFRDTDDAAYETFNTDFRRLRPDWQIAPAIYRTWHG